MTGVFPNKLPLNPESTLSFASEGVLWFQNLTVADPCCVLPVILAFTNFLNIEVCPYNYCTLLFQLHKSLSIVDTLGTAKHVLISEVSSFQEQSCTVPYVAGTWW